MIAQKQYRVIELPEDTTGQQIEDALNEIAAAGYYVVRLSTGTGLAIRAICCLRAKRD